ncbi:MAG: hypothetical protein CMJ18_08890 [Phycisphaeraceae bacterium]|nr:hypothetical protein [Phycisphaeraceae bacterium]
MNRRLLTIVTLMIALTLGAGTTVLAERSDDDMLAGPRAEGRQREGDRGFSGRRKGRGGPMRRLMRDLDLNEGQRKQVREAMSKIKDQRKQWRKEHKAELDEIRAQMKKLRERAKALHASAPSMEDAAAQIRPILDADQQKQFDENLQLAKKRRDEARKDRGRKHERGKQRRRGDRDGRRGKDDKLDL